MYICVKSLFFRLKDEERIRGGLYFVQGIPRDENWKASENIIFLKKPIYVAKSCGRRNAFQISYIFRY